MVDGRPGDPAGQTGNLDLRPECQAVKITHDDTGKVDGVEYLDAAGNLHKQAARMVCVAGNSIESPRLLLMSASALHPDGLANSSGQVGKNYMRHMTGSAYATFERPVRMYRGETMAGIIADEAKHGTSRGFAGGYHMETLSLGPAFLASFVEPGEWGRSFTEKMDAYERTAGMWIVGEDMPQESNRITLNTDVTDRTACRCRTCTSTTTRTTSRCATTATRGRTCCTRRSGRSACTAPRRTRRRTTSVPAG